MDPPGGLVLELVAVLTRVASPLGLALGLAAAATLSSAADRAIPLNEAAKVFAEMHRICARDGGRFWGVSLCGPILFVDPQTRQAVANSPDKEGRLKREGDVWIGQIPSSENISNAPMTWSGTDWTELMWPLQADEADHRHVMMAHEMFHRVQPRLGLVREDGDNSHLDTLEGRYLLQLEWRALARALGARTAASRRQAVADALDFRDERYRLFPKASEAEKTLEYNEGIAEYTGLHVGLTSPRTRVKVALDDLKSHVADETFVRTFAYATGPAYGLLLDRYDPRWRRYLKQRRGLGEMLRSAADVRTPKDLPLAVKLAAARYDGAALRTTEVAREEARQKRLAAFRAKFVDGPVLYLPMHHANVSFVPMDLQPLDDRGVVYTKLRVSAEWGTLEAARGALLQTDFKGVTVAVSEAPGGQPKGEGWTLTLKQGWSIVPGQRKGDFTLGPPPR